MEFDSQLLQDLLEFLRTLEGVTLPAKFEALRGKLLGRMRVALSGHYMDMQHGKPIKDRYVADCSSEEYVTPDQHSLTSRSFLYQHQIKKPDNNETKQPVSTLSPPPRYLPVKSEEPPPRRIVLPPIAAAAADTKDAEISKVDTADPLLELYSTMSWTKASAKSHISGELYRREKWFLFENFRPFWAALVDSHLLSYDNKTDLKPSQILSIKGCTCRPVVSLQHNAKKLSNSTFELCYENCKSVQFIASTPKEMEQWLAMITRWEAKSRDTSSAHVSPNITLTAPAHISEDESSSDESTPNEEYVDIVIDNIAEALANPAKAPKPSPSRSPVPQPERPKPGTKRKLDVQKISDLDKPLRNRVLPPPPSSTRNSEQEEELYQIIEESNGNQPSTSIKSSSPIRDSHYDEDGELYDDIETMKNEVKQIIQANNGKKEMDRKTPVQESAADVEETYDDVDVVKRGVEQIRRNENAAKESAEVEKEKKSFKEMSTVPTKSSPMKNFFGKLRQKKESPQKKAAKKKPTISTPQHPAKTTTSNELPIDKNSPETADVYVNNQTPEELSDYSNLPRPRPVQADKTLPNDIGEMEEEEPIYDDIAHKKEELNNPVVGTGRELEKREMTENSVTTNNLFRKEGSTGPTMNMAQRNVVRNLNQIFNSEIYENQTGKSNAEDDLEHYQVPRSDNNVQTQSSVEDDDTEKIYDDVEIVVKKKREIEQAKPKLPVAPPLKHIRGPPVMAKPFEKNFLNKLNKFTTPSVPEKPAPEKNIQHRFNLGKKPKGQKAIIPLKKLQITSAGDEEIYDDCQAKG